MLWSRLRGKRMNIATRIGRIILQYIVGVVFASGVFIFITYGLCAFLGKLTENTGLALPISLFGTMALKVFLGIPIGALLGICLVDKLIFNLPRYDKQGIATGLLLGILGVIPGIGIVHLTSIGLFPTILGVEAEEFWYILTAVFYPLIGYNYALFLKCKSKAKTTSVEEKKSQVFSKIIFEGKPVERTSRLAVASLICTFATIPSFGLFLLFIQAGVDLGFARLVTGLFSAATLVLGIIALLAIALSHNRLMGVGYAALAVILSGSFLFGTYIRWYEAEIRAARQKAESSHHSMLLLAIELMEYKRDNDGYLPIADKWCDLLMEHNPNLTKGIFGNPQADTFQQPVGACNFAFNKNVSGLRWADIPYDVVVLFEANGDWNLTGGAELFKSGRSVLSSSPGVIFYVLPAHGPIKEYLYKYNTIRKVDSDRLRLVDEQPRWEP
jgi:hypothetical protein